MKIIDRGNAINIVNWAMGWERLINDEASTVKRELRLINSPIFPE
jgi:hypothetical protein